MGAEAVEGGASLFRKEYVGLGLDIRVHNLHPRSYHRAGCRLVTSIGTGPLLSPVSLSGAKVGGTRPREDPQSATSRVGGV